MGEGNIFQMLQVERRIRLQDMRYRGQDCWGVFIFNQNLGRSLHVSAGGYNGAVDITGCSRKSVAYLI